MNKQIFKHINKNGAIAFDLKNGVVSTLKRSPRGNDSWWAEHQYGVHYTLYQQDGDRIYFNVNHKDGGGVRKSGWWINHKTGSLYILATHDLGDRVVEYKPDEYLIRLVYDHELEGFWTNVLSPSWYEEEWFRFKAEDKMRVVLVKIGAFYEVFHHDAILFRDTFGFPLMPSTRAHTGFPQKSLEEFTKGMEVKGIKYTFVKQY